MVKFMFMAGALLGTGTVAMENEVVNEVVTEQSLQIRQLIQNRLGIITVSQVREFGYPYPNDAFLDSLTEEQAFEVVSLIDQANATYDWQNMTDDEIKEAISDIKANLHTLYDELEIVAPTLRERIKQVIASRTKVTVEEVKESGYPYPTETFLANLTEEQSLAITSFIDEVNSTYDFSNMTDEEIETALDEIKADLHDLYVELEIEVPSLGERIRQVVQTKLGVVTVEEVKESGYPYPNEAFLANLTDEQTQAVTTFIDQVNATYDFTSMTDEEIEVVLDEIKADLHDLYDELGIQAPTLRERIKQGFRTGKDNTDNPSSSTEQDDEEFNNDSI